MACGGAVRAESKDVLRIGTLGDEMRFDQPSLAARAGQTITVRFRNNSRVPGMRHNWVLMRRDDVDAVLAEGIRVGAATNYVPANDTRVIAHTPLLDAGKEAEASFIAPPAGTYAYCCTFPGHASLMNGIFVFG